jgi:hypothetical protein
VIITAATFFKLQLEGLFLRQVDAHLGQHIADRLSGERRLGCLIARIVEPTTIP